MALSEFDKTKALDDLKKLGGIPPYDDGGNICYGDAYFYRSIEKEFCEPHGITFEELKRLTGYTDIKRRWEQTRDLFLGGNHGE